MIISFVNLSGNCGDNFSNNLSKTSKIATREQRQNTIYRACINLKPKLGKLEKYFFYYF